MTIQQNVSEVTNTGDLYSQIISGSDIHNRLKELEGSDITLSKFLNSITEIISNAVNVCPSYYFYTQSCTLLLEQDYDTRSSLAINVKIGDYYYLVKRNDAIYISDIPLEQQVNLGQLDCLIASRVFLPDNSTNIYGLFGKANLTRNNQDLYKNIEFNFNISNFTASEYNTDTKESSVMICAEMDILNASQDFIDALEKSENIVKVKISDFTPNDENSTAKLIACCKK